MLRRAAARPSKSQAYASFRLWALCVDGCIPQFYIACDVVGHNRVSHSMYRFRSQFRFLVLATVALTLAAAYLQTAFARAQSANGEMGSAATLTGVDVYERYPQAPFKGAR